jgi:hypothetical protein
LAVRLDADHQHRAAIGEDACGTALKAWDDGGIAGGVFGRATSGLLGERGKANADQPTV